jgi:hypothetical protein
MAGLFISAVGNYPMTLLELDRDQIEIFTDALFRHVGSDGFVSLRAFTHDNKPFCAEAIGLNHGLKPLIDAAQDRARRAAQAKESVVFCPPVATFSNARHATEKDIYEGPALSVELDSYAQHGSYPRSGNGCRPQRRPLDR